MQILIFMSVSPIQRVLAIFFMINIVNYIVSDTGTFTIIISTPVQRTQGNIRGQGDRQWTHETRALCTYRRTPSFGDTSGRDSRM